MMNLKLIAISACLVAPFDAVAFADSITLKASTRLAAGATSVTLSDIAELEGKDASSFADVTVANISTSSDVLEISIREVRLKLDEAGVNWSRINLSGRSVVVRPSRSADAQPPLAMMPAALTKESTRKPDANSGRDQLTASELITQPTLRGTIANLIVSNLQVDSNDLRLTFDRADGSMLDMGIDSTRFELQPLGSFASDRIELAVRIWTDNKVQQGRTISVNPQVRIQAATLRRDIQKDEILSEADMETSELWLPPSQSAMTAGKVMATGRLAAKAMKAGEVIREKNIRRDTLIKRGEQSIVRCLVGGVAISMQAEARADGTEGDTIEFRKQGERQTFRATVTGRGEAIVDLSKK